MCKSKSSLFLYISLFKKNLLKNRINKKEERKRNIEDLGTKIKDLLIEQGLIKVSKPKFQNS